MLKILIGIFFLRPTVISGNYFFSQSGDQNLKKTANPLTSDVFPWKVRNIFFQLKKSCIPLRHRAAYMANVTCWNSRLEHFVIPE